MIEIFEVQEIVVNIDDVIAEKYTRGWNGSYKNLTKTDMEDILGTELAKNIKVLKCKLIEEYADISTYSVKFITKEI